MGNAPTASHSLTIRLEIQNQPGMLGKVTSAIGKAGGDIGEIDLVEVRKKTIIRDLTFKASDDRHGQWAGRCGAWRGRPPAPPSATAGCRQSAGDAARPGRCG